MCWLATDGKLPIKFIIYINILNVYNVLASDRWQMDNSIYRNLNTFTFHIIFVVFIHDDVIEALIDQKMYTQSIYNKHI